MDKLVLIDGHSILNRAFFGLPDLTNSQGLHTNAVYGFLNILFKILEEEISSEQYGVGFKLGNEELRDKVQKTLDEMVKDGTFMKIAEQWGLEDSVCLGK